jgi:hypothetical protein
MGYIDGEFVFIPGFGRGIFGQPYDNKTPQGQVYGVAGTNAVPFWCRDPERRALTLLHYMERRARIFKPRFDSYQDRLFFVTLKLAEIWAKKFEANERRRNDSKFNVIRRVKKGKRKRKVPISSLYHSYGEWLGVTKEFPEFLKKIVDDYFPMDDESLHWDVGQIAFNSGGGLENKSHVRRILKKVDQIGRRVFPEPEPAETEHAQLPDVPFSDELDPDKFI